MNAVELLLIHSRLKYNMNVVNGQFRKPMVERNLRLLQNSRDSIRNLNRWLYMDKNVSKVSGTKSFIKAVNELRNPSKHVNVDSVQKNKKICIKKAYKLIIQKASSLTEFGIEINIKSLYTRENIDEFYHSRNEIQPSKWITISFCVKNETDLQKIQKAQYDLKLLCINFDVSQDHPSMLTWRIDHSFKIL